MIENVSASAMAASLGYSSMFVVSGSMAIIAMFIYVGTYLYMHRTKSAESIPA